MTSETNPPEIFDRQRRRALPIIDGQRCLDEKVDIAAARGIVFYDLSAATLKLTS